MKASNRALAMLGIAAFALISVQSRRLARARATVGQSLQAYSRERHQACYRVVLLGDSTGVGIGCNSQEESIAARLAREHPQARVTNLCVSGARVEDVRCAAEALPDHPIDLAIVLAGGNDVLHWTSLDRLQQETLALQETLCARARHVVWAGMANVGRAPLFVPPFSWLMTARARSVSRVLRRCAERTGVCFVNFFREAGADPFSAQPQLYYGVDGVHPSGAAYSWCYRALRPFIGRALGAQLKDARRSRS